MGAWYVFASLGLYPLIPGVGGFSTNIPQFMEAKSPMVTKYFKYFQRYSNGKFLNK